MNNQDEVPRVVAASREIATGTQRIFGLIADPAQQPGWDVNNNLQEAAAGQRIHAVGHLFTMTTTKSNVRENHVVEFAEHRRIAWKPAETGQGAAGALVAIGPRADRRVAHACYPHLRLDPVGRRRPPDSARSGYNR